MMTHKYRKPWMGAALAGSMLTAFVSFTPTAHAQFGSISEREEIEAGQQVARQAIKEYGNPVSSSDPRQRRVSRIGAIFTRDAKRKNIPYSFTVLNNNSVLNAFAAPGGPIMVTSRLVDTTSNDAELAFVIAHEVGHIENKHAVKQAQRQSQVGLAAGILGAILGRGGNSDLVGTLGGVAVSLWSSGYSRDQENDSDSYAARAMARNGFDPRAAVSMLGKLGGGSSGLARYLATHPAPASRQNSVSNLIQKENLLSVAQRSGGAFTNLSGSNYNNYAPTYTSGGSDLYPSSGQTSSRDYIQLRTVERGNYRVILAPVRQIADYAGGEVRVRGSQVTVSRQGAYITFNINSSNANLNGRGVDMSAPAQAIEGTLYAPLGPLANGLNGTATYENNSNRLRLDFGGGRTATIAM